METKLARYFLWRLRHESETAALSRAVETGILTDNLETADGDTVRSFAPGAIATGKSFQEIARLLQRQGLIPESSVRNVHSSMEDFWQNEEINLSVGEVRQPAAERRDASVDQPTSPSGDAARRASLSSDIVAVVRRSAEPPRAMDVATLMLLANGASKSGKTLNAVLDTLKQRAPIIMISAAVKGFEKSLIDLLGRGIILPGTVAECSGYECGGFRFPRSFRDSKWRIIVFEGRKFDSDNADRIARQVGLAAQSIHPILGIAEGTDHLPEQLRNAAQLDLDCGPLTPEIVAATMKAVLGDAPDHIASDGDCSRLDLSDLAIAIRPGVTPSRSLEVLHLLAKADRAHADESGTYSSGTAISGNSTKKTSGSSGRGKDQSSGSEIIQPVKTDNDCKDSFVPRVETLSGYGAVREWALALKDDLDLWRKGELSWDEMSTKLLLSGSPGTGKTTFARALCNTLQVPLIVTSVATWLEPSYLGDVIKRMKTVFAEAEAHKPCILFVDEFDGIGQRQPTTREYSDYWNSVVNRLLELLDGAAKSSGVIVVGATNNPAAIEPALLRSGRLETKIVIPLPDTNALVGILRHHLKADIDAVIATAPDRYLHDTAEKSDADLEPHPSRVSPEPVGRAGSIATKRIGTAKRKGVRNGRHT